MTAEENGPKNPLEQRLGYQLRRASVAMMADLAERLAKLNLRTAEAAILIVVGANPALSQTETGRMLGIQRANMVPLIAGLLRRGLVGKKRVDGRSQALRLTPAGQTLADKAERCMREHEESFLGRVSQAERKLWLARLRGIWGQQET
jgi:DNA-binding MarR family transcriptional regulator